MCTAGDGADVEVQAGDEIDELCDARAGGLLEDRVQIDRAESGRVRIVDGQGDRAVVAYCPGPTHLRRVRVVRGLGILVGIRVLVQHTRILRGGEVEDRRQRAAETAQVEVDGAQRLDRQRIRLEVLGDAVCAVGDRVECLGMNPIDLSDHVEIGATDLTTQHASPRLRIKQRVIRARRRERQSRRTD